MKEDFNDYKNYEQDDYDYSDEGCSDTDPLS
jgi:hypothetical protein